jgi:uncharacterized membrane protein HdeD (DUF308 family)
MLNSLSTSLIWRGLLALGVGIVAIAWPAVTVLALVVLFAVYAFMWAGFEAVSVLRSRTAGPVFGHLISDFVDIAAGVVALAWPRADGSRPGAARGRLGDCHRCCRGLRRFGAGKRRTRAMFIIGGLVSVAFGVVLFARPYGRHLAGPAVRIVQPDRRQLDARVAPSCAGPTRRCTRWPPTEQKLAA